MSAKITQLKDWYERHERQVSTGSLLFGFVFDSLTLQRIDALRDNLWLAVNLAVVGICIILLNNQKDEVQEGTSKHFWLTNILQFGFGALLGGFFIFYFRSATLSVDWPFLLLLLGALVANELYLKRYPKLVFQLSFFYLAIFSFAIYLVPLFLDRIGPWIFLLSGALSLLIIWLFIGALNRFAERSFRTSRLPLWRAIGTIFVVVNIFYFINLIPPLPLSLQDVGVYHSLSRTVSGGYAVGTEKKSFLNYIRMSDHIRVVPGESLYAYSAVYAPADLDIGIVHEWQYKNGRGEWVTASRVALNLSGGREDGFRTYSTKSHLAPGLWRVNVETSRGALIGRVGFRIIPATSLPPLVYSVKK